MLTGLLHAHSVLRYFVLILLIIVIVNSLLGLMNKKPFGKMDNRWSLFLLIFTHIQFLVGLVLYILNLTQNRLVQFNESTMKTPGLRYWAVEHLVGMLVAVVLITVARSTSKRMPDDSAKHKRLLIFNLIALIVIVVTISIGDRGLLTMGSK